MAGVQVDCRRAASAAGLAILDVSIESSCTAANVDVSVLQGGKPVAPTKSYANALFADEPRDLATAPFPRPPIESWLTVKVDVLCDRANRRASKTNECQFKE
jgi:hypothetical protein